MNDSLSDLNFDASDRSNSRAVAFLTICSAVVIGFAVSARSKMNQPVTADSIKSGWAHPQSPKLFLPDEAFSLREFEKMVDLKSEEMLSSGANVFNHVKGGTFKKKSSAQLPKPAGKNDRKQAKRKLNFTPAYKRP